MQLQNPAGSPPVKRPNILPLLLVGGAVTVMIGLTVFVSLQAHPKSSTSYAYPTQSPVGAQTYDNPFVSPSPTYENPFAQSPTAASTDGPYQNPFAGGQ